MTDSRAPSRHLISPFWDFLTMGGLSAAIFLLALIYPSHHFQDPLGQWFGVTLLGALTVGLAIEFFINLPHFAYSYQILYHRFFEKLHRQDIPLATRGRIFLAGVLVPAALIYALLYGMAQPNQDFWPYIAAPTFFFLGWHYAKQGYGALIVLSSYQGYYFTLQEKNVLRWNVYVVWLTAWIVMLQHMPFNYLVYRYPMPGLIGAWVMPTTTAICCFSSLLSLYVIFRKWRKEGRLPPLNGLVGYICPAYLWVLGRLVHPFFMMNIPIFHAIQYLPFVYRYKLHELGKNSDPATWRRMLASYALVTGIGITTIHYLPRFLDEHIRTPDTIHGPALFLFCSMVIVNIHHFFIDHAIWRQDNPDVRSHLFHTPWNEKPA